MKRGNIGSTLKRPNEKVANEKVLNEKIFKEKIPNELQTMGLGGFLRGQNHAEVAMNVRRL
ncbi:hypothetical protein LLE49_22735 [Alicyclobacillus tolerans]|uniref:hypothetical protein n=1 Tax=Alicyclobacillus tolerans TaxID=90970 RepID=UPI001F3A0957|nr:hypothetical protein [Alicyclobacillus tolerans]MCF8567540.1 hypothetical protein [Alicyclobacillus tolerans]